MEKRKPRESITDEVDLAKSAAWAWLERRPSSGNRSVPKFEVLRTKFNPKPSRYKAEAMREVQKTSNSTSTIYVYPKISSRGNSKCSLLDIYEIERISRQLDCYIKSSHANHHSRHHGGRRAEEVAAAGRKNMSGQKKASKGVWLLGSQPVMCGSSRDEVVDNRTSIKYSRRRRPEKGRVPVVEVRCRPRQGIRV